MISASEVAAMIQDPEVGVSAVFNTYACEDLSPATGKVTRGALTAHSVTVMAPNAGGRAVEQFGDTEGVREAELFSIVAAQGLSFTPYAGQEFVWDGKTWSVTWVNPIRTATGVIAYEFGIKGKAVRA